jgi:hypothetical protein
MNKNYEQTGGKKLALIKWSSSAPNKHQPQFTKRPSSKRVLKRMKND